MEDLRDINLTVHGYLLLYDDEIIQRACINFLELSDNEKINHIDNLNSLITVYKSYSNYDTTKIKCDIDRKEYYDLVHKYMVMTNTMCK